MNFIVYYYNNIALVQYNTVVLFSVILALRHMA